eukprot:1157996-Pelagomonas_calceolata.AAC.7
MPHHGRVPKAMAFVHIDHHQPELDLGLLQACLHKLTVQAQALFCMLAQADHASTGACLHKLTMQAHAVFRL